MNTGLSVIHIVTLGQKYVLVLSVPPKESISPGEMIFVIIDAASGGKYPTAVRIA